jgi:hypothetical protein
MIVDPLIVEKGDYILTTYGAKKVKRVDGYNSNSVVIIHLVNSKKLTLRRDADRLALVIGTPEGHTIYKLRDESN